MYWNTRAEMESAVKEAERTGKPLRCKRCGDEATKWYNARGLTGPYCCLDCFLAERELRALPA